MRHAGLGAQCLLYRPGIQGLIRAAGGGHPISGELLFHPTGGLAQTRLACREGNGAAVTAPSPYAAHSSL